MQEFLQKMVVKGERLPFPRDKARCPTALRQLLEQCWLDAALRPTTTQLVTELRLLKAQYPA